MYLRKISFMAFLTLVMVGSGYGFLKREMPSAFYSQFSLGELVRKNGYVTASKMSEDGIKGGGGGAAPNQTTVTKSESYSCLISRADGGKFEEKEFISSLKKTVEEEIKQSGLTITKSESLKSSSLSFEYEGDGIKGQAKISGKRNGDYYSLKASLMESRTRKTE